MLLGLGIACTGFGLTRGASTVPWSLAIGLPLAAAAFAPFWIGARCPRRARITIDPDQGIVVFEHVWRSGRSGPRLARRIELPFSAIRGVVRHPPKRGGADVWDPGGILHVPSTMVAVGDLVDALVAAGGDGAALARARMRRLAWTMACFTAVVMASGATALFFAFGGFDELRDPGISSPPPPPPPPSPS